MRRVSGYKADRMRSAKKQVSQDFGPMSYPLSMIDGSDMSNQKYLMTTQQKAKRISSGHIRTQKKSNEFLNRRNSR